MSNSSKNTDPTLSYYSDNAEKFVEGTVNIDMMEFYQEFLPLIPDGGAILDAGCGSGRDTKYFLGQGYQVVAFDNCPEIVKIASDYTGHEILQLSFSEIDFTKEFDGVWACASLLHISSEDLPDALLQLSKALKPNGILYTSFKYGEDETFRGGRFFKDYTESSFDELLTKGVGFRVIKYWKTNDLRPGREDEEWVNILLRKV